METAFGSDTTEQMLGEADRAQAADGDGGTDAEAARQQALEQYVDDQVLDEEGRLREDVTAAELQQAIDDDMADFGPSDLLGGTAPVDEAGADGSKPADEDEQRAEAIVQELGGTGEAGSMGTGTSLAGGLIDTALGAATDGRLGSSVGGAGACSARGARPVPRTGGATPTRSCRSARRSTSSAERSYGRRRPARTRSVSSSASTPGRDSSSSPTATRAVSPSTTPAAGRCKRWPGSS
jgi:hypothetical protein